MIIPNDITGKRFGRLSVIKLLGTVNGIRTWECLCDCGNTKLENFSHLNSGAVSSCGCLHMERLREQMTTHGKNGTAAHVSWRAMKNRCLNPRNPKYGSYGGRGIKVCKRWMRFENFLEDMGERPKGTSIDRINNSGNYEPSNCRWATRSEQASNTRRCKKIPFKGKFFSMAQVSEMTGIKYAALKWRINKSGWPLEKILKNESFHNVAPRPKKK